MEPVAEARRVADSNSQIAFPSGLGLLQTEVVDLAIGALILISHQGSARH